MRPLILGCFDYQVKQYAKRKGFEHFTRIYTDYQLRGVRGEGWTVYALEGWEQTFGGDSETFLNLLSSYGFTVVQDCA